MNSYVVDSPLPSNISYLYNYGSIIGIVLVTQIITGILLAMHYTAHIDLAFISVEHIMRDVNSGWLLRYAHANGASCILYSIVFAYRTWIILWFIYKTKSIIMECWGNNIFISDGNSIFRLCITLGTNDFGGQQ